MRKDLILKYLGTSVERLNLVQRHLMVKENKESSTENPTTFKEKHGESTFDSQILSYLQLLKDQVQTIEEELKNEEEE